MKLKEILSTEKPGNLEAISTDNIDYLAKLINAANEQDTQYPY